MGGGDSEGALCKWVQWVCGRYVDVCVCVDVVLYVDMDVGRLSVCVCV